MNEDWLTLATALGYESEKQMFEEMYAKESLKGLARRLSVSHATVKKQLDLHGIVIRKRGGVRSKSKVEVTVALVEQIEKDGLLKVSKRIGVSKYTLFRHRRIWFKTPAGQEFLAARAVRGEADPESPETTSQTQPDSATHPLRHE